MQIPCVYLPGPAPAVSVANKTELSDTAIVIHKHVSFCNKCSFVLGSSPQVCCRCPLDDISPLRLASVPRSLAASPLVPGSLYPRLS
jgi:hypothetical protein